MIAACHILLEKASAGARLGAIEPATRMSMGISSRAFHRYRADVTQDSELERARLGTCTGRLCTCGNVRKEGNPARVNPWLDEGTIIQYPQCSLAEVRCYCAKPGQPREALIRASPSLVSGSILRRLCPPDETRFEKARRT